MDEAKHVWPGLAASCPRLWLLVLACLTQGLAKAIAWDGEGATCLMEIAVTGAKNDAEARQVGVRGAGQQARHKRRTGTHLPSCGCSASKLALHVDVAHTV